MLQTNTDLAQQFSPFRKSMTEFSPGKSFYRNQESLEVGELDHVKIIQNHTGDDIDQLQQDLNLLTHKVPTPEWFMAETPDNRLKVLELLQTGVSYMHFAYTTRKEYLQDLNANNERKVKEVTNW